MMTGETRRVPLFRLASGVFAPRHDLKASERREGRQVAPEREPIVSSAKNADARRFNFRGNAPEHRFNGAGVTRILQKSDDFGKGKPTFEISGRISIKLSGNMKSCLSF